MNLNTLFKINVFVSGLFGLGFVFAPEATLAPYGLSQEIIDGSVMVARWFGGANIGYGILSWMMSNSQDSDAKTNVAKENKEFRIANPEGKMEYKRGKII